VLGIAAALLRAAALYAQQHGARTVEGYSADPKTPRMPDVFAFTGLVSAFRRSGCVEVLRRSETRPMMRYVV
jgi:hypothetical protein